MSLSTWNPLPSWGDTLFSRAATFDRATPGVFPRASGIEGDVKWNVCGEGIQCANISVPLDYNNPSDGRTITIAVNRIEATDKANRKGAIFVNPGGPGGAGTGLVFLAGAAASDFLKGQYDFVGFDPRGVGQTRPYVSCFDSLLQEAAYTKAYNPTLNLPVSASALSSSDVKKDLTKQIGFFNASIVSLAQECFKRTGEAIGYVGTEAVVRDIDFMSRKIYGDDERINYWGLSYGTVIGQYMVKILPASRLGKILIDGVVNADVWNKYALGSLQQGFDDTDKVFEAFASTCVKAGQACSLNALQGVNTASALVSKVDNAIDSLYSNPVPGYDFGVPAVVNAANLRSFIFSSLYSSARWPQFAAVLTQVLQGNVTNLIAATTTQVSDELAGQPDNSALAGNAIYCADTKPYDAKQPAPSSSQLADIVLSSLRKFSRRSADQLWTLSLCSAWDKAGLYPRKTYYNGTFELAKGALSTPALITSNTLDNVTPLVNAKGALQRFNGNGRLVQQLNGVGHTTLSDISFCTGRIIYAYFINGTVPSKDLTLCDVDQKPFVPFNASAAPDPTAQAWGRLAQAVQVLL